MIIGHDQLKLQSDIEESDFMDHRVRWHRALVRGTVSATVPQVDHTSPSSVLTMHCSQRSIWQSLFCSSNTNRSHFHCAATIRLMAQEEFVPSSEPSAERLNIMSRDAGLVCSLQAQSRTQHLAVLFPINRFVNNSNNFSDLPPVHIVVIRYHILPLFSFSAH